MMGDCFGNGVFVVCYGLWNCKLMVGYDVVFIGFDVCGNLVGKLVLVLIGFFIG